MLTFTLKEGQKVHIGDEITVLIRPNPSNPNQVKLSIDAPRDVKILRDKLKPHSRKL